MEFKQGDIVTIKHFSDIQPIKSVIVKVNDNCLTIKLTKDFAVFNFFEGDPAVLGYEKNNEVYVCECMLTSIMTRAGLIELSTANSVLITDRRVDERFPVSLYADVKCEGVGKRIVANVKNFSISGLSILCKHSFEEGQALQLDVYLENGVLLLNTEVAWTVEHGGKFEHGLKITRFDPSTKLAINSYLKGLRAEQEKSVKELRQGV